MSSLMTDRTARQDSLQGFLRRRGCSPLMAACWAWEIMDALDGNPKPWIGAPEGVAELVQEAHGKLALSPAGLELLCELWRIPGEDEEPRAVESVFEVEGPPDAEAPRGERVGWLAASVHQSMRELGLTRLTVEEDEEGNARFSAR
jgi:hypothetical protein